ncbi:hypothetical protein ACFWSF_24725 [Streptomyces sp. NPDC058611]|uniref:hypothetical protein n=1 Tax=unclassified Streptomyces TaxID=2593676 RepID=UPI00365B3BA6
MVLNPLSGQVSHEARGSLVLPVTSPVWGLHLADCLPFVQEVLGPRQRRPTTSSPAWLPPISAQTNG